jgi:hypothetical protein
VLEQAIAQYADSLGASSLLADANDKRLTPQQIMSSYESGRPQLQQQN